MVFNSLSRSHSNYFIKRIVAASTNKSRPKSANILDGIPGDQATGSKKRTHWPRTAETHSTYWFVCVAHLSVLEATLAGGLADVRQSLAD